MKKLIMYVSAAIVSLTFAGCHGRHHHHHHVPPPVQPRGTVVHPRPVPPPVVPAPVVPAPVVPAPVRPR